jgi:hypothetical protein
MSVSAAELIRQVAALPPEEKAAFLKMIQKMENGSQKGSLTNGPLSQTSNAPHPNSLMRRG